MPKKVVLFGVGLTSAAVFAVGTWGMVTLLKVNFAAIIIGIPLCLPLVALFWCVAVGLGAIE